MNLKTKLGEHMPIFNPGLSNELRGSTVQSRSMVGGVVAREKSAKSQLNAGRRTLFSSYHIIKVITKLNFKMGRI